MTSFLHGYQTAMHEDGVWSADAETDCAHALVLGIGFTPADAKSYALGALFWRSRQAGLSCCVAAGFPPLEPTPEAVERAERAQAYRDYSV